MPDHELVVRGADAVLPDRRATVDIGIDAAGRIAAVALPGTLSGRRVVEAEGLIALPGGVDLHVHINTFFGGVTTRDDFLTGTAAALFGGTTTIAQFALPRAGETSADAVARTRAEAGSRAVGDYAIHGAVVAETYAESLGQLRDLAGAGIGTVKVFSAYTDVLGLTLGQIQRLLARAADEGITVFVHAETDSLIVEAIEETTRAGTLGPDGHARSRPRLAEVDAIRSIAALGRDTGARVYIVHVSAAASVDTIRERRAAGDDLLAETCPHYLVLDESVYGGAEGARWICSPPMRSEQDREALWAGIRDGTLDAVSSDHNCFDRAQKDASADDFRHVPNGLPGIETRLPLLVAAAIDGRLEWRRLVEIGSETPARILGLWPTKGTLAPGADADVVLLDPAATTVLGPGHMATDFSPYDGMRIPGRIETVFRRGAEVVSQGSLQADPGSGHWLAVPTGARGGRTAARGAA